MRTSSRAAFSAALASILAAGMPAPAARAADPPTLTLRNHRFTPDRVAIPAGTRLRIAVVNADPTPAEFESDGLRVEKIVPGGGRITVLVGPLQPGDYHFFDDYHRDTAQGVLTAAKGG